MVLTVLQIIRDMGLPNPAGGFCLSPWLDLTHSFPSFQLNHLTDYIPHQINDSRLGTRLQYYAPNNYLHHPYVSPIFSDNLKGLPPLLFQTGGAEKLLDEIVTMAEKIREQNGSHNITLEVYEVKIFKTNDRDMFMYFMQCGTFLLPLDWRLNELVIGYKELPEEMELKSNILMIDQELILIIVEIENLSFTVHRLYKPKFVSIN